MLYYKPHFVKILIFTFFSLKCYEMTQFLISAGADVNAKDKAGYTPIREATTFNEKRR